MKRARETHEPEDAGGPEPTTPLTTPRVETATVTVTQAKTPSNHNTNNSTATAALQEIRAKLEQARRKKIAAEERLWRQKQQTSVSPNASAAPTNAPPATASDTATTATTDSTATTATTTTAQTPKSETKETTPTRQGILTNPRSNSNITRAQEAQEALDRARSRLQGALQNRERALQQQQQQQQQRMNNSNGPFDPAATPGSSSSTSWNRKRRHSQQTHFSLQTPGRYASHGSSNNNGLPPISALSPSMSLRISEISKSGPPDMVFHHKERKNSPFSSMGHLGSRRLLEAALGGKKAVRALHQDGSDGSWDAGETTQKTGHASSDNDSSDNARSQDGTKSKNTKKRTAGTTASATKKTKKNPNVTSTSLLQRKIQLQNELMALKEKLEMKSSQEPKHKPAQPAKQEAVTPRNKKIATKEGLERRKAEAQTIMDISYWKHFVSKQEHLLEQVSTKINNLDHGNSNSNSHHHRNNNTTPAQSRGGAHSNNNTYQECLQKRHSTNKAIAKVQFDLDTLEQRQEVVEEGIVASTQQLLETRQLLYEERAKQSKETTTKGPN